MKRIAREATVAWRVRLMVFEMGIENKELNHEIDIIGRK